MLHFVDLLRILHALSRTSPPGRVIIAQRVTLRNMEVSYDDEISFIEQECI